MNKKGNIKEYIIKFYNEKEKVFNKIKAILNRMTKESIIGTAYRAFNIFQIRIKMLLGNRPIIQNIAK